MDSWSIWTLLAMSAPDMIGAIPSSLCRMSNASWLLPTALDPSREEKSLWSNTQYTHTDRCYCSHVLVHELSDTVITGLKGPYGRWVLEWLKGDPHEFWSEAVDQGTQGQPRPPGLLQVLHLHPLVVVRVALAPPQQVHQCATPWLCQHSQCKWVFYTWFQICTGIYLHK